MWKLRGVGSEECSQLRVILVGCGTAGREPTRFYSNHPITRRLTDGFSDLEMCLVRTDSLAEVLCTGGLDLIRKEAGVPVTVSANDGSLQNLKDLKVS